MLRILWIKYIINIKAHLLVIHTFLDLINAQKMERTKILQRGVFKTSTCLNLTILLLCPKIFTSMSGVFTRHWMYQILPRFRLQPHLSQAATATLTSQAILYSTTQSPAIPKCALPRSCAVESTRTGTDGPALSLSRAAGKNVYIHKAACSQCISLSFTNLAVRWLYHTG